MCGAKFIMIGDQGLDMLVGMYDMIIVSRLEDKMNNGVHKGRD